jgi:AbiV family abortive infection protein
LKNLSFEELMIARAKILQNAKDLIIDSEILLDNQRYSRAYTLLHLASEELAKLTTMHSICIDVLSGETINWNKVDKKLRDHKDKIKRAFEFDLFCGLTSDNRKSIRQYEEGVAIVGEYNIMKNA